MSNCGTCKFLRRESGRRLSAGHLYPCDFPLPELPKFPASVDFGTIRTRWMAPDYGRDCPVWQDRKSVKAL